MTFYDAVRLVQNDDGIFLKLNDPILSRSAITLGSNAAGQGFTQPFLPLTMASDCTNRWAYSTADLRGTDLIFSPSILPYGRAGYLAQGSASLSENNQLLTVSSKGYCAHTYFRYRWYVHYGDGTNDFGDHLLSVTFS